MNTHVRDNLSFLKGTQGASEPNSRTYTNSTFLDLDALTGGSGTIGAVAVTVATDTTALVHIGAQLANSTLGSLSILTYKVSGATTIAGDDAWSVVVESGAANDQYSVGKTLVEDGLTAGSNTFEVQARVSGNTGTIQRVHLAVTPI